jgi:hypothetical protein
VNEVLDSDDVNITWEEDNKDDDIYVEVATVESSTRESRKRSISIQSASRDEPPTKMHQGS